MAIKALLQKVTRKEAKKGITAGEVILSTHQLCKSYQTPHGNLKVLKGVDLEIKEGEMSMIVGRSGSGKSTLLHLLGGLDRATLGKIFFKDRDLSHLNDRQISEYRLKHVGFVFQFYHLLPELTLLENVLLPTMINGGRDQKRAKILLSRVGLSGRADHYPSELSGGELQRTAIARALMNQPDIVLCDEPTGNLDEQTADQVFDLLIQLQKEEKTTFVIVTHESALTAYAQSIYELRDGVLEKIRKI
ncbi:MAG: lipoprotein-releasing system ATP-binding protein LolD [Candidatus Omnitrophica bacterium CG11_big_fil_rev_8_21_14_0_20_45_26]|uniref:Lipoprotein-releasing system ATP-binding protein LolD n=1 Tax=Candidatus Abzuiibacterium crystallinum TaxID=1974748 RepID=A0A2H0LL45_9BACT|nr:MAG: lipoprotein-releasing system ATP-binding protein LolD [Candidatus Omnitrophica bacterium CG11_big_fil_rev_8_21_14_0_20_45_26]PIW63785.1 MAG: lipoprotein-releasing system ATP-binding protein LolD [Candidatus Omnitrophica bacterium CG12_big_fil_rev_8_21_14_0_65_45_16]